MADEKATHPFEIRKLQFSELIARTQVEPDTQVESSQPITFDDEVPEYLRALEKFQKRSGESENQIPYD